MLVLFVHVLTTGDHHDPVVLLCSRDRSKLERRIEIELAKSAGEKDRLGEDGLELAGLRSSDRRDYFIVQCQEV